MTITRKIYFDGCVICGGESFGARLCHMDDCAIQFERMQIVAELPPKQQPAHAAAKDGAK